MDHGGVRTIISPRKVDFLLKISVEKSRKLMHIDVADYEHKSPSAGREDVGFQLRKS